MDQPRQSRTITIISLLISLAGIIVMSGWLCHVPALQSILPGFIAIKFNSGLCFVLFGNALLLSQYQNRKYNLLYFTLSGLGALIGLITIYQDLFSINTGFDQLFVTDKTTITPDFPFPGRMAFNSAINFSLLGLAFLSLPTKKRLFRVVSQYIFHFVTILSAISLIGYLYGVSIFRTLFYITSMPVITATLFFILSLAASLLNPSLLSITRLFTGKQVGNQMARRLFSLLVLMIVVFGSLRNEALVSALFSSLDIGMSILAVCFLLFSLLLIWNTAIWLNKIDTQRYEAVEQVKSMNIELEKRVERRSAALRDADLKFRTLADKSMVGVYIVQNGVFTYVNPRFAGVFGYGPEELENDPDVRKKIFHESYEKIVQENVRRRIAGEIETLHYEAMGLKKDGTTNWVEIYGNRVIMGGTPAIIGSMLDITERKLAEDLILKEKALSDSIINSLPGVFYLYNDEFRFLRWNKNFETVTGYSSEEIAALKVPDVIAGEDLPKVEEAIKKVFAEGYTMIEARSLAKDGTKIPFLFTGSRITYENQLCLLGTGIDISSRMEAEDALRLSEQKYKLLFERNPLPLWMIAKDDLAIIAVNDAAADLYGYTKEELLTMNTTEFIPPEDSEMQQERYKKEASGADDLGVIRHIKKDGSTIFVQIIAHDIVFEGRPVRLSLTNDITEKLFAEESFQKSEANLQTILKTTDTAYALFDLDLKVLAFNQKAIEFVKQQYNHNPEKGDQLSDFFPIERFPQFINFTNAVLKGNNINYEIDYPQTDGTTLWYYVRLFPITNDNKEILGVMMALYDITERKSAEYDLKSAYERIQGQINSIKDMAWKQSHLIRRPLANLKGLAEMLKNDSDPKILNYIQTELDLMDVIILEMADEASDHTANNYSNN